MVTYFSEKVKYVNINRSFKVKSKIKKYLSATMKTYENKVFFLFGVLDQIFFCQKNR